MSLLPEITPPYYEWREQVVLDRLVWIWDPLGDKWFSSVRPKATLMEDGTTVFGEKWRPWTDLAPGF